MEILFKNATVVACQARGDILTNRNFFQKSSDVGIRDGKITFDTKNATAARVIDCTHKVLMPGLYNCHTHAGMTLFRGFANDRTLEDWLFNHLIPAEAKLTPALVRIGTQLAMAEMLASGTVAFSDMYCHMDEVTRAADESGILANISNGVVALGDDFVFENCNEYRQTLRALEELSGAVKKDGRVKIEASIHGCYTSSPPTWECVADFAQKNNLRMHVHLSETKTEHDGCVEKYGATPAQMFAKHGVFESPTLAAHGCWATDEDMEILREKSVTIAHNPLSNLKLASGLAPVVKFMKSGVNVALGTDGVSSNNSHDLFEEMKMASLLQKYATNDPTAVPASDALKMATINGARAQGRENESGQIKEGFDADVILLDFNTPRQTMCYDPVLNLAYSTSGRDVEMTIVRGKVLYEKGEFMTIDVEKILHEARKAKKIFE
ncbi:MAG: amidohydrolase family protein [Defluviitaleaceae bacterium]|nr:amidohydrolase family protein [Defluviitaleaceae bacterium]